MGYKYSGNKEEWRRCGKDVYDIRCRLIEVSKKMTQKLLPKKDMHFLNRAIEYVDEFRCHAEEEMPNHGGPDDNIIWYPGPIPYRK